MTEKFSTYEKAREHINDGDIVFIRDKVGPIVALIRFFTRSRYSHVGIAFWINTGGKKRLMFAEAQGGAKRRIVNISYYDSVNLDVVESASYPEKSDVPEVTESDVSVSTRRDVGDDDTSDVGDDDDDTSDVGDDDTDEDSGSLKFFSISLLLLILFAKY